MTKMKTPQLNRRLLQILRISLSPTDFKTEPFSPEDLNALTKVFGEQKLLPAAIDALHRCQQTEAWEDYPKYNREARIQVTQQTLRVLDFLEVYEKLKEAGILALVVKGCVCSTVWPNGDLRISGDEDVYVRPTEFRKACEVLQACGLTCDEKADPADDFEIGWRKPDSTLYIELHQRLFSPHSQTAGDLQHFFDDAFARAQEYDVEHGAAKVWSMSPEDHLLYLILHAFKHFTQSGFGIRQVCDIGLWAKRYADAIDWQRLMRDLEKAHALYFTAAVFAIAREDLGIDLQLPEEWDKLRVDREPMLADLLDAGIYGGSSRSRQHSSPMLQEAVAASRENRKKTGLLRRVFPPKERLLRRYPELREHPARLPAVWLKRIVKYRKEIKSDENNSAIESIRIARQREELLRCYHII